MQGGREAGRQGGREAGRERALLGTTVHNGGSRAAPAARAHSQSLAPVWQTKFKEQEQELLSRYKREDTQGFV
jgi:hypothetical protein